MKDTAIAPAGMQPAAESSGSREKVAVKPIIQVVAGNALEIYDFMIYGYYARYIAQTYFPSDNEYISLMMSLMTFAFGFLARPIGAIVLGAYTDRHGRRAGLIMALSLMSLGIISVACTPSYASIGMAAPIIVLLGRLLQGFSAGAELGGVVVYLAEIAPPKRRAFYTCWQAGSQQISVMVASLVGLILLYCLAPEDLHAWGWRIPLLLGCLVIPVMFWLRSSLQETEVFAKRKSAPKVWEICTSLVRDWRIIALCMGMVSMATVTAQTITTYAPTFIKSLNLGASAGFVILFFGGLSVLIWLPIMATVADRFNRRTVLIVITLLAAITAYPLMSWLAAQPTVFKFAVVELWFSFIYAAYSSVQVATMVELVPPSARTSGYAFAQAVAAAVLGGFTPAILTWLTHTFHSSAMVGVWLAINAAISFLAALALNKKKTAERQVAALH
jgi:MFS transporter, MHS family, citrate/tricarballylate:H+ symporter